jgi:hypothetical protein
MAIAAIDAVIADVMLMAELNWLFAREKCLSVIGRPVEFEQQPDDDPDEEDRAEDADFRYEISASMKDLAHRSSSTEYRSSNRTFDRRAERPSKPLCGDCTVVVALRMKGTRHDREQRSVRAVPSLILMTRETAIARMLLTGSIAPQIT